MSRLASFHQPSTPSSTPVKPRQPSSPSSSSSSRLESTYHRKLRTLLLDLRAAALTWDSLVLIDGLKAAKSLVDTRTELEYVASLTLRTIVYILFCSNALAIVPDRQPRSRLVGPKLALMEKRIAELDTVISKLVSTPARLSVAFGWRDVTVQHSKSNSVK
jgi:hypothetical protein